MASDSLYAVGWRQGSVLDGRLTTYSAVRTPSGKAAAVIEREKEHDIWIVVTQDCSLDRTRVSTNAPVVELRPVYDQDPPAHWGIHATKFLLNDEKKHYLVDGKAAKFVSPRLLSDKELIQKLYDLSDPRVLALKTWLGNRYDRPAVPNDLIPLARAIASAVRGLDPTIGRLVREVYMEFDGSAADRRYSLYAVTDEEADPVTVREWLAGAANDIPVELGVAEEIEALKPSETSLALVEQAYCADLSQITWEDQEDADGAF